MYVNGVFTAALLETAILEPFTGAPLALLHTAWTPGVRCAGRGGGFYQLQLVDGC